MEITSIEEFKRRKKTVEDHYKMSTYIEDMEEKDGRNARIRSDQEVQRLAGQYSNELNNELIYTILCGNYLPPILLCEDQTLDRYIGDGLQRSTCFRMFKKGNMKITSKLRDSIVPYLDRKVNEDGETEIFVNNCDIRGKTYETLPRELQKAFDDFTLTTIVFENRTQEEIIDIVRTYNTNKSVNPAQKAFMNIGNYAKEVREILDKKFFIECTPTEKKDKSGYTEKEKINGTMERVVTESVMLINHFDNWKKQSKDICDFLNEESCEEEFISFSKLIDRLGEIYTKELGKRFTSKNSFIWFSLFNKFTSYNLPDNYFVNFVSEFNKTLHDKVVNIAYKDFKDITYDKLDNESGTKDKILIEAKMEILEYLMMGYLHIEREETQSEEISTLDFVRENVGQDVIQEDIVTYEDSFKDYVRGKFDKQGNQIIPSNYNAIISIIAYAFNLEEDDKLEGWLESKVIYGGNINQVDNYNDMVRSFDKYIDELEKNNI